MFGWITVIAGGLVLGIVAVASAKKRPAWTKHVPQPGQDGPTWATVDAAICHCPGVAANADAGAITACVWQAVYPGLPLDARQGDDASLGAAHGAIASHVAERLSQLGTGQWSCEVQPFHANVLGTAIPFAATPTPGSLYTIRPGDNPTTVVRRAFNLQAGSSQVPKVVAAMVRSGWNLYAYSREKTKATAYTTKVGGKIYDVGPAFYKRNADAHAALLTGKVPLRTVSAHGAALGNGHAFGSIWHPGPALHGRRLGPSGWDPGERGRPVLAGVPARGDRRTGLPDHRRGGDRVAARPALGRAGVSGRPAAPDRFDRVPAVARADLGVGPRRASSCRGRHDPLRAGPHRAAVARGAPARRDRGLLERRTAQDPGGPPHRAGDLDCERQADRAVALAAARRPRADRSAIPDQPRRADRGRMERGRRHRAAAPRRLGDSLDPSSYNLVATAIAGVYEAVAQTQAAAPGDDPTVRDHVAEALDAAAATAAGIGKAAWGGLKTAAVVVGVAVGGYVAYRLAVPDTRVEIDT